MHSAKVHSVPKNNILNNQSHKSQIRKRRERRKKIEDTKKKYSQ